MILVAVTGGIGAGKTSVLEYFARCGAEVADADALVHQLYEPGSDLHQLLEARWGQAVVTADGALLRSAIADIVFSDPLELQWLNEQVHPRVRRLIQDKALSSRPALFCAIPLLFESGWEGDMTYTVAVWCDPETQRQRLRQRGWDEQEMKRRINQQLSMDEKLRRSDYGIVSHCSRELLAAQCQLVYQRIMARAAA
jgi:dephospho-CoA kinase